jgi:hypothetical protein
MALIKLTVRTYTLKPEEKPKNLTHFVHFARKP